LSRHARSLSRLSAGGSTDWALIGGAKSAAEDGPPHALGECEPTRHGEEKIRTPKADCGEMTCAGY